MDIFVRACRQGFLAAGKQPGAGDECQRREPSFQRAQRLSPITKAMITETKKQSSCCADPTGVVSV